MSSGDSAAPKPPDLGTGFAATRAGQVPHAGRPGREWGPLPGVWELVPYVQVRPGPPVSGSVSLSACELLVGQQWLWATSRCKVGVVLDLKSNRRHPEPSPLELTLCAGTALEDLPF